MNQVEYKVTSKSQYATLANQSEYVCESSCTKLRNTRTPYDMMQFKQFDRLNTASDRKDNYYHGHMHGLLWAKPDDPVYNPIGGRPGGLTWN